ncbi:hypothetical protein IJD15_03560 [bacterium]|nr:hypothetical protein [bacterium]
MISLDIDLSYLSRYYHINTDNWKQYKNMSITEIMQTEAEQGNTKAAEFLMRITSNPEELCKLFQLADPKNRYLIIAHMNKDDQMKLMEFLKPEELVLGLSIFTQEALVELMKQLPPETLATVVLEKMDPEKFLQQLPEEYMNEFLSSDKMDKNIFMAALEEVDESELQKMMEHATGQPCYDNSESIIQQMGKMDDHQFQRAVLSFEPEGKRQLIAGMLQEKPELFEEFSPEAMTHPFKTMQKEEILKSLTVLETQELLPMVENLPQDVMALIATQIDPEVFSKVLCSDFANIIASCGFKM